MSALLNVVAAVLAAVVVGVVLLACLFDRTGPQGRLQRLSLCMMAGGLLWAAPARLLGYPPGLGDLMFLGGLSALLLRLYGAGIWAALDGLDGELDGLVDIQAVVERSRRPKP